MATFLDDEWFFTQLRENLILSRAHKAFKEVHGGNKSHELTIEILQRHNNVKFANECRASLSNLENIVPLNLAQLVRYSAAVYANFCDEIFACLDDFYFQSVLMEWLLHSSYSLQGKRYRDHLTHQLKVATLCMGILDGTILESESLMDHVIDAQRNSLIFEKFYRVEAIEENEITPGLLEASLLLSSMFHDIGYCFVNVVSSAKHLTKVSNFFEIDFSEKIWKKISHRFAEHSPIVAFYRTYGEGLNQNSSIEDVKNLIHESVFCSKNHSVIGALYLLYMLDQVETRLEESLNKNLQLKKNFRIVFEIAALAILTHDIDSPEKREIKEGTRSQMMKPNFGINFDEAPIGYILGVCDQIQDWGRVRVQRVPADGDRCYDDYIVDCKGVNISLVGKSLNMQLNFGDSKGIIPAIPIFGAKKLKPGGDSEVYRDLNEILAKYQDGRIGILNKIYGKNPIWEKFNISAESNGTIYNPEDFFSEDGSKSIVGQLKA